MSASLQALYAGTAEGLEAPSIPTFRLASVTSWSVPPTSRTADSTPRAPWSSASQASHDEHLNRSTRAGPRIVSAKSSPRGYSISMPMAEDNARSAASLSQHRQTIRHRRAPTTGASARPGFGSSRTSGRRWEAPDMRGKRASRARLCLCRAGATEVLDLSSARRDRNAKPFPAVGD
jgi:hypothetical protein